MNSVRRVALVTGASSGLGMEIAKRFLAAEYDVFLVSRDVDSLRITAESLTSSAASGSLVRFAAGDVTSGESVDSVFLACRHEFSRLDVLVNCVGSSDRGLAAELTCDRLDELMRINVESALLCSQAALPLLKESAGAIVNIGSLASKVGARYLGGYALAKHALASLTQQMRLELRGEGVHVGIVCPGPIRRDDAGSRYRDRLSESLPASAAAPAAGAKLKGLDPGAVADEVLRCAQRRVPEIIMPGHVRWLVVIASAMPRLGDWLLLRFTSAKPK